MSQDRDHGRRTRRSYVLINECDNAWVGNNAEWQSDGGRDKYADNNEWCSGYDCHAS